MSWRGHTWCWTSLSDKGREFVTGEAESTDGECEWHSENEEGGKVARDMKVTQSSQKKKPRQQRSQLQRDSEFRFTVFRNVDMPSEPLKASGGGESLDEDSEFTLASAYEIGHFFRERLVPRAMLYFTGETIEDDHNFEEGEEGEEEGDEEDDAHVSLKKEPSQPSECKQQ
uniref:Uncharacterized protein n=1 Tax=Pipistrellus kuhlii TaxID=59472 RepID=A0A7J7ZJE1_PIPKU|nr:hypothetical protein mPipKuh1_009434 [Pipistrellus kuhlii]